MRGLLSSSGLHHSWQFYVAVVLLVLAALLLLRGATLTNVPVS
jgi:hypothetical protein